MSPSPAYMPEVIQNSETHERILQRSLFKRVPGFLFRLRAFAEHPLKSWTPHRFKCCIRKCAET